MQINMTTDTPRTMTNEQIRIAIAEACGTMKWSYALPTKCIAVGVPDYCNDLNAMHEAEKTLGREQWDMYELKLGWITGDRGFRKINATAAQRAEAFLQTFGKWENDK